MKSVQEKSKSSVFYLLESSLKKKNIYIKENKKVNSKAKIFGTRLIRILIGNSTKISHLKMF